MGLTNKCKSMKWFCKCNFIFVRLETANNDEVILSRSFEMSENETILIMNGVDNHR